MEAASSTAREAAGTDCPALLEAARPDLYRGNAFRVADLHVDATPQDVSRQTQKAELLRKYGDRASPTRGALPLRPPPDTDAVREAVQRLRDPERRLVDELSWFWPSQLGQCRSDVALRALEQGDVNAAARTWAERERTQSETGVAAHNLAVLFHALALDLEHVSLLKILSEREVEQRNKYWQAAFQHWKAVLSHEGFWTRFAARVRELDDPRLTPDTVRCIRATLPLALLSINAQLALRAAERLAPAEARRHLAILQSWGDPGLAEEALGRTIKPARERIKMLCRTTEEETNADPAHADQVVWRLFDHARPLLATLDGLLPEDHLARSTVHDDVALQALLSQVAFGKETGNWRVSLELLKQALTLAVGPSARERLEENIRIVEGNLGFAPGEIGSAAPGC